MKLNWVRSEIERMRGQLRVQEREIRMLQRAGIATASAELLLGRMRAKVDDLCRERNALEKAATGQATHPMTRGRDLCSPRGRVQKLRCAQRNDCGSTKFSRCPCPKGRPRTGPSSKPPSPPELGPSAVWLGNAGERSGGFHAHFLFVIAAVAELWGAAPRGPALLKQPAVFIHFCISADSTEPSFKIEKTSRDET
ncbi:hypothetical protein [Bradyrhizobium sp. RDM4]|uniref:hypothetical protein n=1 Tax=Bradyrhizobium sp. RDM4 TaxID=3378765 RepID=UPI0038FC4F1E